VKGIDRILKLI